MAGLRYKKAIPPEDNSKSESVALSSYPCHARDIWAFGNFILAVLNKSALDGMITIITLCFMWFCTVVFWTSIIVLTIVEYNLSPMSGLMYGMGVVTQL